MHFVKLQYIYIDKNENKISLEEVSKGLKISRLTNFDNKILLA